MLCPGFVDLHAHSALEPFRDPVLTPKILQGFTTEVICPDGLAPAPVRDRESRREYLRALEGDGPPRWTWTTFAEYLDALPATASTLVPSAPHGAIREFCEADVEARCGEVRLAFEAGARMLSFGLVYLPGVFAETEELVAMARVAAEFGAPLVPHVRNEGHGVIDAVREMIEVSQRSGAQLHVSHLKCLADESLLDPLLELVDSAGATFDQYPYGAGSTLLAGLLPPWAQEGGAEATLRRARSPETRRRDRRRRRARVARLGEPARHAWPGERGRRRPHHCRGEAATRWRRCSTCSSRPSSAHRMIIHYAGDDAVRKVAAHPRQLVGSDGIFGEHPHPRLYGTAPRFLGRFALRDGLIPVDEAVARLTARAADLLGLQDRGRIAVGKRADLVLLDGARLRRHGDVRGPEAEPRRRRRRVGRGRGGGPRRPGHRCDAGRRTSLESAEKRLARIRPPAERDPQVRRPRMEVAARAGPGSDARARGDRSTRPRRRRPQPRRRHSPREAPRAGLPRSPLRSPAAASRRGRERDVQPVSGPCQPRERRRLRDAVDRESLPLQLARECPDRRLRPDGVTDTPRGHRVRLREAAEDERPLAKRRMLGRGAMYVAVPQEADVRLVRRSSASES
jgi:N-acyl-D-amino-acid deacylase